MPGDGPALLGPPTWSWRSLTMWGHLLTDPGEDAGPNVKVSNSEFLEACGSLHHTSGESVKKLFYFQPRTESDGVQFF